MNSSMMPKKTPKEKQNTKNLFTSETALNSVQCLIYYDMMPVKQYKTIHSMMVKSIQDNPYD